MKQIVLACGRLALVDDVDYDLNQYNWCAIGGRGNPYAGRGTPRIYMYLVVVERKGLSIPVGMEPDHKDRNTLNNCRDNLRIVTKSLNRHNTTTQLNNTSGVRGVNYNERRKKWVARISISGHRVSLGYFDTLEQAAVARLAAEKRYGVRHG